ncbi:phenylphosphate carboxylase subunit delta [Pseudoluteimonas lycopersici]|uniref:3-deoxy-D-manno-octulosonate 8-phosphate phosphatase KdsC n=1 Tax=Pseudoluteimonas lycopersici TaxID=1324796 RepID=A0A516V4S0_9GAMM|nr:HAD hydrolase family protein [Lysobacter lycopersici]QDQ73498.1 phenylphosphate carboxylase subunit delta [Lysobacter lycopersici]
MATNTIRPDYPADVLERAARIRVIGFDVDGTLTDGRLLFGDGGEESKAFHVQDGLGIKLLQHAGIEVALVTARVSAVVERRGRELGIARVHTHTREKLACLQGIAAEMDIGMDQVAFMGDDLPDLATLRAAGLAIIPANAHDWVKPVAHWTTPRNGGEGAARDACDLLLHAHGRVDAILAHGEHP